MNPATPGPLTILLVPPPGDIALLADEAGGRVPWMWERPAHIGYGGHGKRPATHLPARWLASGSLDGMMTRAAQRVFPPARALVLVHEGALVRLGIFRAWDMADDISTDDLDAALTMSPTELAAWVGELRRNDQPIGRVVLLRDGEVES